MKCFVNGCKNQASISIKGKREIKYQIISYLKHYCTDCFNDIYIKEENK